MSKFTLAVIVGGFFLGLGDVEAAPVTYLFIGGDFDFDAQVGVFTDSGAGISDGLQITFEAFVGGLAGGTVNATSSSLGINAPASGDATDQLDGDNGNESLTISFNDIASISSVTLTEIQVVGFGDDAGTLTIGANSSAIAAQTGTSIPAHTNLEGESFTVAFTSGTGFGLRSMSLEVTATAVPEPSSLAALIAIGLLGLVRLRRAAQAIESSLTSDQ